MKARRLAETTSPRASARCNKRYGGGLHGELPTTTDLILWNNGMPSHESILRLGRAVLIPPRQNLKVEATLVGYDTGTNGALFQVTQGTRSLVSSRDNLNAVDLKYGGAHQQ